MLDIIKNEIRLIIKKERTLGYTLAEMLMVMLIVSLMILALPPATKKIYKERTTRRLHGRYECYRNAANQIVQASATEGGVMSTPAVVDKCTFTVPRSSIYVLVHAVGGGGGGAYVKSIPTDTSEAFVAEDYYGNTAPHLFSEWVKELRAGGYNFPNDSPMNMSNKAVVNCKVSKMQFGYGGLKGERISMFFSKLDPSVEIEMIPGAAGIAGTSTTSYKGSDGTDTVVNFIETDEATGAKTTTELIRAAGGMGGGVAGESKIWLYGGAPSDYGLANISARKRQSINFAENIEGRVDDTLKSHIVEAGLTPGDGGGGAYSYINNTATTLSYTIEGVQLANRLSFRTYLPKNSTANTDCYRSGNQHICRKNTSKAFSCVDGQTKNGLLCMPQNGGSGAVVILW